MLAERNRDPPKVMEYLGRLPVTLSDNQESREETLKYYTIVWRAEPAPQDPPTRPICVDFKRDTLYLNADELFEYGRDSFCFQFLALYEPCFVASIRFLELHANGCSVTRPYDEDSYISHFGRMKEFGRHTVTALKGVEDVRIGMAKSSRGGQRSARSMDVFVLDLTRLWKEVAEEDPGRIGSTSDLLDVT